MPRQRPGERRCICGHDRTVHAWPERRSLGLGACSGQGHELTEAGARTVCRCERFVTPGQRRFSEYRKRRAEDLRAARELYGLAPRTDSQED